MIINTKGLELGKTIYYIDIPTEKTVICENIDSDDNFDRNGNCKKNCYRDCCLPQASVVETIIDAIDISVTEDGTDIIVNGYLKQEDIHFNKADAEEKLEDIRANTKENI